MHIYIYNCDFRANATSRLAQGVRMLEDYARRRALNGM